MKQVLVCSILFLCSYGMEGDKIIKIQEQTWPLRDALRKLKNITAGHRCKLSKEDQASWKCREGMVASHLDNVLRQLDHVKMDVSNQKFEQIDKHFSKANDHLGQAKKELQDYKNIVQEITKVDIDSQSNL